MTYQSILYEVETNVLTITLNRPDRLNAFNGVMLKELLDALDKADGDDDIRAIIVTGAGRGFCAGADLAAGGDSFKSADSGKSAVHRDGGGLLTLRIFELKKPIIAAINGPAVGVGITMTLAMDIRLASDQARIGFVFARRGIAPEACSSWFLPRIVGIAKALEWVYSGKVFPASEALQEKLVTAVYPPEELLPAARGIAKEIAENTAPLSIALSRQMLWKMLGADHPMEAHKIDSRAVQALGKTSDAKEGVESFLEKRPPNFNNSPDKDLPDFYPWWHSRDFS
jgi:enoyl-CoA hydratase/carnithine racemase